MKFLFRFLFFQILLPGILLHGSFDFSLFLVGAVSFIYDYESIRTTVATFVVAGGLTIGGIIYAYESFQKVKPTLIYPLIQLIPLPYFLSCVDPFVPIISLPLLTLEYDLLSFLKIISFYLYGSVNLHFIQMTATLFLFRLISIPFNIH